jgi:hypothetical protein
MLALVSLMNSAALAQPGQNPFLNFWNLGTPVGSGTGNWNVPANWSTNSVPNVATQDGAVVSGGGTIQINSAIATNVGSVVLGQGSAAGQSGTLEIQSGGSLNVVDDPMFPADGSVRVGQDVGQGFLDMSATTNPNASTGTLRVLPGGTLNSVSLQIRGNAATSVTLGGAGAGMATVNTGIVTSLRTLRVIGSNVNFNSTGPGARIAFETPSIFIPEITGATHSPLKTTGTAYLGGTLQADFTGVTPAVNQTWDIIDAAAVERAFTTMLPDPMVPLGTAQRIATRTVNGGTNGKLVQMFVQQMPVLNVNRDTGAVTISNPGTTGVPLDGYTIGSALGGLSTANWQSLEDNPGVAGAGWFEGAATANRLSEVRSSGNSTLAGSGSWSIGNIFRPQPPTQFGVNPDDVTFQYDDPETQSTVDGIVNYSGIGLINNLALFVDPATGNVKIRNTSPFNVQIDGYTISSVAGSLNSNPTLWTSLQDQPGAAPNWFEGFLTDNRVSEVMSTGTTTLMANSVTTFDLGGLFKTGGTQDLVFEFLQAGNAQPTTGVVRYQAAPTPGGVTGDYNNNGTVDAADYVLWRNGGPLQNEGATPGTSTPEDYTVWRANFGKPGAGAALAASAAVPEPTSVGLLVVAAAALAAARRRG